MQSNRRALIVLAILITALVTPPIIGAVCHPDACTTGQICCACEIADGRITTTGDSGFIAIQLIAPSGCGTGNVQHDFFLMFEQASGFTEPEFIGNNCNPEHTDSPRLFAIPDPISTGSEILLAWQNLDGACRPPLNSIRFTGPRERNPPSIPNGLGCADATPCEPATKLGVCESGAITLLDATGVTQHLTISGPITVAPDSWEANRSSSDTNCQTGSVNCPMFPAPPAPGTPPLATPTAATGYCSGTSGPTPIATPCANAYCDHLSALAWSEFSGCVNSLADAFAASAAPVDDFVTCRKVLATYEALWEANCGSRFTCSASTKVISDNLTKLDWECKAPGNCSLGHSPTPLTWSQPGTNDRTGTAFASFVQTANQLSFAGSSTWRMPTLAEMVSTLEVGNPTLTGDITGANGNPKLIECDDSFTASGFVPYWTDTALPTSSGAPNCPTELNAWYLNIGTDPAGGVESGGRTVGRNVRLVRNR